MFLFIVIFICLLGVSAFFSGSETAFFSIPETTLKHWENASSGKCSVSSLMANYRRTLIVILLGNMFVNVLASILGGRILAHYLGETTQSAFIALAVVTMFLLLFGEITPKTIALQKNLAIAPKIAPIFSFFIKILSPLVYLLDKITNKLLNLFQSPKSTAIRHDEYKSFIAIGAASGIFSSFEEKMLLNTFLLREKRTSSVMCHRKDMRAVESNWDVDKIYEYVVSSAHDYLPVYNENLDNIMAVLDVIKYLSLSVSERKKWQKNCLLNPAYLPENATLEDAMTTVKENPCDLCVVVDEYGGVSGIITEQDIRSQITGKIYEEFDLPRWSIKKISKNHWLVGGGTPLDELERKTDIIFPENESENLAGLIAENLKRIPKEKDTVQTKEWKLKVLEMNNNFVAKIEFCTLK
ncbi:MAG: hemolysin family protein [Verrucomicrobiota bacterium]|nr:hemolysin family protein [Verrucomicrobiota bacterium]